MKQMKKSAAATLLCVLVSIPSTLTMAADRAGAFFVRPSVGYYFPASKRQLHNAGTQGLSLGYDFKGNLGITAGVTLINTDQNSNIGGQHVHGFLYTLDGIYRLNNFHQFKPYLMAGPQLISLKPATGSDPVVQAGVNAGAGVGYYFSDSVGMSFEAQDLYTFSGGKNDVLLSAGLTFLFGGR